MSIESHAIQVTVHTGLFTNIITSVLPSIRKPKNKHKIKISIKVYLIGLFLCIIYTTVNIFLYLVGIIIRKHINLMVVGKYFEMYLGQNIVEVA